MSEYLRPDLRTKTALKFPNMSYEAYLSIPEGPKIAEWTEGEVIFYMPPLDLHQDILRFLSGLMNGYIELLGLGVLRFAPFEVKLWPAGPSREPDILFVSKEKEGYLKPERFVGAPDLIAEIISHSSVTQDRVKKFIEYEQAGVREYWLIDPRPSKQQVDVYVLGADGAYQELAVNERGCFESLVLPGFWLDPAGLWLGKLPNSQWLLADMARANPRLPAALRQTYDTLYRLLTPS